MRPNEFINSFFDLLNYLPVENVKKKKRGEDKEIAIEPDHRLVWWSCKIEFGMGDIIRATHSQPGEQQRIKCIIQILLWKDRPRPAIFWFCARNRWGLLFHPACKPLACNSATLCLQVQPFFFRILHFHFLSHIKSIRLCSTNSLKVIL